MFKAFGNFPDRLCELARHGVTKTRRGSGMMRLIQNEQSAGTEFAEHISPQIFGREVTQTLLIHANDINADCLDELLRRLAGRGYSFVTLDEAMKDPAYQTKDTLVSKSGPTWLWRWMKSKGMNISFADDPEPPQWVMGLYRQWLTARFSENP